MAAALAIGLVVAVVNWLPAHWWVLVVFGSLAAPACGGRLYHKRQRDRWEAVRAHALWYGLSELDALHHSRFEDAVRELMRRDGCRDAVRVGGRGDLGADRRVRALYALG
ncbi:restriction endonuclease [Streptomyces sp. NBC_01353]|uniref:restriction endonuclease n=1 Tax=Streptomyces sp. NBC_01353 TaxID=2903835 RepID=UPI002E2FBCA4|nr:hypothetical protein [Streptomyces sp. NBC_01353]